MRTGATKMRTGATKMRAGATKIRVFTSTLVWPQVGNLPVEGQAVSTSRSTARPRPRLVRQSTPLSCKCCVREPVRVGLTVLHTYPRMLIFTRNTRGRPPSQCV